MTWYTNIWACVDEGACPIGLGMRLTVSMEILLDTRTVESHTLASSTKRLISWKRLGNYIQHVPSCLGRWDIFYISHVL
jgi:hypothetical protein